MCAPFGDDPPHIRSNYRQNWSQHKVQMWDKYVADFRAKMKEKGWDPNDKDNPLNSHPATGLTSHIGRMQWSQMYEEKYNTPGQGVHASGTGRELDDPTVTAPQAGAAASGRDQNLGAGGGTSPQSNPESSNTNQSKKDQAGSKKDSKKESLKIPKPDVNIPNGDPSSSSGGVNN